MPSTEQINKADLAILLAKYEGAKIANGHLIELRDYMSGYLHNDSSPNQVATLEFDHFIYLLSEARRARFLQASPQERQLIDELTQQFAKDKRASLLEPMLDNPHHPGSSPAFFEKNVSAKTARSAPPKPITEVVCEPGVLRPRPSR